MPSDSSALSVGAMTPSFIFLDFDGVLHPDGGTLTGPFVHADALGGLLAAYREAQVFVSSSWRETSRIDCLLDFAEPCSGNDDGWKETVTTTDRPQRELDNRLKVWSLATAAVGNPTKVRGES